MVRGAIFWSLLRIENIHFEISLVQSFELILEVEFVFELSKFGNVFDVLPVCSVERAHNQDLFVILGGRQKVDLCEVNCVVEGLITHK